MGRTVKLLREAGHQVRDHRPGPLIGRRRADQLRAVPYPVRRMRVALPWGAGPDGAPADVVHVHTTGTAGMTGFAYAARHRLPVVVTWHIDMLAYVRHYPDLAMAAASSAHRMRLGWSVRDYLELSDWNGRRHHRLSVLGHGLFERTRMILAPSRKAALGLRAVGKVPEIRILPTPVTAPPVVSGSAPLSGPALSDPALSDPALSDPALSDPALSGPALSDPALSGPALSGPALCGPSFCGSRRAQLGLPADAPVVLHVGRVTPEKNPALLLTAFKLLLRTVPGAHLVLVGAHQGRRAVRAAADRLGLGDRVRLIPPVPPRMVAGYYRMADVLAFPSLTDTQGLVLAEAEACGLPVVVADEALAHRIDPGLPPRIAAAPDPALFAAAIVRLLRDETLRSATIETGRRDITAFTPERYLTSLVAAYQAARA
ncbi:glycosyltransferase [Actinoplanes sp. NBRC 103695]|uniref:glycosyltransferase n=1 Tax=Actinoplanes sp. NBRC 103695 TaxID=3032202 RepID=UPI00255545C1|nr:glycosyltransferase [Actinoplanes sp. NBRC 103695]